MYNFIALNITFLYSVRKTCKCKTQKMITSVVVLASPSCPVTIKKEILIVYSFLLNILNQHSNLKFYLLPFKICSGI